MVREFTPIYEQDESEIRERMLARISDDWRKEPGDFVYDAVAAAPLEVKELQKNQDNILQNAFPQYAVDSWLDEHLHAIGLTRGAATYAERTLLITADQGVTILAGHTLSTVVLDDGGNPLEYSTLFKVTFRDPGALTVTVRANEPGSAYNVKAGSAFIITPPIPGIRSVEDVGATILAKDRESDEAAYARYDYVTRNPDTGGNRHDYVRWVQDNVPGVGRAKTIPRWNGNGTVKVLLLGEDQKPASPAVVALAQVYLDPGETGLGDGKAPAGAKVRATAATGLTVDVTATVYYAHEFSPVDVSGSFEKALDKYFQSLAFSDDPALQTVVWAKIGALLITTPGVANYSDLKVNGGTVDLPIGVEQVPVRGTVTI